MRPNRGAASNVIPVRNRIRDRSRLDFRIIGATSGIGHAGALRLAAEGADLVFTGTNPERLETPVGGSSKALCSAYWF